MNLVDIVNDPKITEKSFKLGPDYTLDVIFSDFDNEFYKRAVLVKLDNVPVMVATSTTKIENNLFIDILKNSREIPISTKLFAPKSGIRRRKMKVTHMSSRDVDDTLISNYLNALGFDHDVYVRESTFSSNKQTMDLKEYVLPGLKFVIDKQRNVS